MATITQDLPSARITEDIEKQVFKEEKEESLPTMWVDASEAMTQEEALEDTRPKTLPIFANAVVSFVNCGSTWRINTMYLSLAE